MRTNFNPISIAQIPIGNPLINRKRNKFNDPRLLKTYKSYSEKLITSRTVSINQASKNESEAKQYYRFLNNQKVTMAELIESSCTIEEENLQGRHLLVIGDSCTFNMGKQSKRIKDIETMGVIQDGKTAGFHSHVNMVVCPESSTILGLSDMILWNQSKKKRKLNRKKMPLEQKYSHKWHLGATHSKKVLSETERLTFIFDREADSFELLSHLLDEVKSDFVIRQSQNRLVKYLDKKLKVDEVLEQHSIMGSYKLDLPSLNHYSWSKRRIIKRKARKAILEVKAISSIKLLATATSKIKDSIQVNLIEVKEKDCPIGDTEGPVHWRLWTTHDVNNLDAVRLIINYYVLRWMIEQLFRVVKKQGFQQESTQLETVEGIMKQTIMVLKAGCKVLQLVYSRENENAQPIKEVFNNNEITVLKQLNKKFEGSTTKQKNNNPREKLSWATWVIARLGGWKGYTSRGLPGPITMKRGLEKFYVYFDAFEVFNSD